MPGRVDMRAGMIRHRDERRRKAVHIAGIGERILMALPDAMDQGRVAGIGRGAVVELAAEVDDFSSRGGPVQEGLVLSLAQRLAQQPERYLTGHEHQDRELDRVEQPDLCAFAAGAAGPNGRASI
jgi:hypothetical protein